MCVNACVKTNLVMKTSPRVVRINYLFMKTRFLSHSSLVRSSFAFKPILEARVQKVVSVAPLSCR